MEQDPINPYVSNEGSEQAGPWIYRHPLVREVAETDDQLRQQLEAVDALEERLAASPDDPTLPRTLSTMRGAVEEQCRKRFGGLLEQPSEEG